MGDLKRVEDLNSTHIGQTMRVQNINGGFIEGTLTGIEHHITKPFDKYVQTFVYFEEFGEPILGSKVMKYYPFETFGNREATLVVEEPFGPPQ